MMLPFIFIILVLIFDFGQAYLERQRMDVAIREMGMRDGGLAASGGGGTAAVANQLSGDTLRYRRMSANFAAPREGSCPANPQAADTSGVNGAFSSGGGGVGSTIGGFLGTMSRTQVYQGTGNGARLTGRLLAPRPYSACYVLDSRTWTYGETGGLSGMFSNLVSGVGGMLGRMF